MAATTVDIGGAKLNKKALYVAGAVGVGVVGYAWWTRKPEIPGEVVTESELDKLGDERIPTTGVPYDPNVRPTQGIVTNAEWAIFATDRLNTLGYDPIVVADALGAFLDRRPLTPAEANIARAAIAQAGEPPVGRPWPVLTQQPVASVGLLAPANLRAIHTGFSGGQAIYTITWDPVAGAKDYHRIHVGGHQGFDPETAIQGQGVPHGQSMHWRIAARNAAGVIGPYADLSFVGATPAAPAPPAPGPAPAPPSGSPPPAPGSLGVLPGPGGRVGLSWPGVPGATVYRYRWETASERSEWAHTTSTTAHAIWLFEPGTQFSAVVQAGNQYGWSAPTGGNNAWAQ